MSPFQRVAAGCWPKVKAGQRTSSEVARGMDCFSESLSRLLKLIFVSEQWLAKVQRYENGFLYNQYRRFISAFSFR